MSIISKEVQVTPALFSFESKNIRVITDANGEALFVGKDICDALGYADATTAIRSHCRGVQILHPIPDVIGRKQDTRVITEPDVLRLIINCNLPAAVEFEKLVFEVILPTIRKTGTYTAPKPKAPRAAPTLSERKVKIGLLLIKAAAEQFKYAESSVLGCMQRLEKLAGVSGLLPHYAVDAPIVKKASEIIAAAPAASSEPTSALKFLLKEHRVKNAKGADMTPAEFNKILEKEGALEQHIRPSSNGETSKYWSVVDLEYGKNITSPNNPRETQPHWYVAKFPELLDLVAPGQKLGPIGEALKKAA